MKVLFLYTNFDDEMLKDTESKKQNQSFIIRIDWVVLLRIYSLVFVVLKGFTFNFEMIFNDHFKLKYVFFSFGMFELNTIFTIAYH